ncbi:NPCBM/NEW2 domain-containing protein [Paenibacillus sp. OAS669]|uniref:NPCBM/NEW2 domain-containing protein n=1 Tax=Paenibacillus sp. OAS669 TaxID=2663821 RepID=UPI00178B401D|nr:NPCBM/NEW2 domain-containing protein [Paenibacillus sp. OAS669]MBE1446081.1 hypothetical protein [Paenibacillus sp. OAS669]
MSRMKNIRLLASGFLIGAVCFSGITYAAVGGTQIEVYFNSLKYKIDGIEKKPSEGQGFIYDGTTYVPLRFIGEALGKNVEYEGGTGTIWVGKKEGRSVYLSDIEYARKDTDSSKTLHIDKWQDVKGNALSYSGEFSIAGTKYSHGIGFESAFYLSAGGMGSVDYNLDGKYRKLTGLIGIDDYKKNSKNFGTIKVLADGKEIYSSPKMMGGDKAIPIDIDVTGVAKMKIIFTEDQQFYKDNTFIDLVEAKLFE